MSILNFCIPFTDSAPKDLMQLIIPSFLIYFFSHIFQGTTFLFFLTVSPFFLSSFPGSTPSCVQSPLSSCHTPRSMLWCLFPYMSPDPAPLHQPPVYLRCVWLGLALGFSLQQVPLTAEVFLRTPGPLKSLLSLLQLTQPKLSA